MKKKELAHQIESLISPYRVTSAKNFSLSNIDPGDTQTLGSDQKPQAQEWLIQSIEWLSELQDKLYAQNSKAILLIFQAMDAAGKDSTIKHVLSGVNPQGCQVYSFKQPSAQDLNHDFMWRYLRCLPERGRIGIFNRSYYEEVLVVRVHKEILERQRLPKYLVTKNIWTERLNDLRNFEDYLGRNGITVLKFYLHLSKHEQQQRLLARLDKPEKNWKFDESDLAERALWKSYMKAYQEAIKATASKDSPWYVVPADNKWFTRLVVGAAIVDTLRKLDLDYPAVSVSQKEKLEFFKRDLLGLGSQKGKSDHA